MSPDSLTLLIRAAAVWIGLGAVVMGATLVHGGMTFVRSFGQVPAPLVLITLIFGGASILGVVGALALWRGRQKGRVACIVSGAALIIGVGPAAILRGQALVLTLLSLTLAAVLCLCSRPVGRLCSAAR